MDVASARPASQVEPHLTSDLPSAVGVTPIAETWLFTGSGDWVIESASRCFAKPVLPADVVCLDATDARQRVRKSAA